MSYTPEQYAIALAETLRTPADIQGVATELERVAMVLLDDAATRACFVGRGAMPHPQQLALLHRVFGETVSERSFVFLGLLLAHHDVALLDRVIHLLRQHATEAPHAMVVVESVAVILPETRAAIEAILTERLERAVSATYAETPACLAGIRITIDGTHAWDDTVSGKLDRLRRRIAGLTAF